MGISKFIKNSIRILKLAKKPSKEEMWMSARICLLAMFLVGFLSFGVQLLMSILTSQW